MRVRPWSSDHREVLGQGGGGDGGQSVGGVGGGGGGGGGEVVIALSSNITDAEEKRDIRTLLFLI